MTPPGELLATQPAPTADASFQPHDRTLAQNWPALRTHLLRSGLTLDLDAPPRQFSAGLGNLNYLIKLDGQPWVLRRPPLGDIPPGGNDMRREYSILSKLSDAYPLAPRAIYFSDDKAAIGAPFLIMEYRPGLVIGGELPSSRPTSGEERMHLGMTLVDMLADLHSVDVEVIGLGTLGRPDGMLERMVEGWSKRAHLACASTARVTPPGVYEVVRWLQKRQVAPSATCLLHSDFKLDNVILHPMTLEPRAVIDWDMGTRGDPLVDVATLLSYWSEPGDPDAMLALNQMPTTKPGFPNRADVLQAYATRTGVDLDRFDFYRVLAMFKLTVVFMQLHARHLRGEATQERFATFGTLSAGLLDCTRALCAGALK